MPTEKENRAERNQEHPHEVAVTLGEAASRNQAQEEDRHPDGGHCRDQRPEAAGPSEHEQRRRKSQDLDESERRRDESCQGDVGDTDRDGDRHEHEHRGDRGPLPDAEVRLVCWSRADFEDPSQHHGTDSSTGDPSRDGSAAWSGRKPGVLPFKATTLPAWTACDGFYDSSAASKRTTDAHAGQVAVQRRSGDTTRNRARAAPAQDRSTAPAREARSKCPPTTTRPFSTTVSMPVGERFGAPGYQ